MSDNTDKADLLNSYFCSVFTKEKLDILPEILDLQNINILQNIELNNVLVTKKLENLNVNKSMGPDELHPRVLKELAVELGQPLAILFTKSLREGKLPSDWKEPM